MKKLWDKAHTFFAEDLWEIDVSSKRGASAFFIMVLRFLAVIINDILDGSLPLWAMSFVYTTLLSFVPLLAVGFSVLKAFGVHNQIEPFLFSILAPLGPKGTELTYTIVEFIDNMKVGVLGIVGLATLVYTVISLIQKVEEAFNAVWRVRTPRSLARRFSDYLSVIVIGPVLVVSAMALTASILSTSIMRRLVSVDVIGTFMFYAGQFVPYILICAAFTFVYIFIPNTKVRLTSALVGGIFGGVLWETVGWGFGSFIVTSTRYAAIYSGFAIVILFMMWLYLSWLILLIGAEVSFYHQNPQFLSLRKNAGMAHSRLIEQIAVSIMFLIGENFYRGRKSWTLSSLVHRLGVNIEPVEEIIGEFLKQRLITETAENPPSYLPARDIGTILLREIYEVARNPAHHRKTPGIKQMAPIEPVDRIAERIDEAIEKTIADLTLRDIVAGTRHNTAVAAEPLHRQIKSA